MDRNKVRDFLITSTIELWILKISKESIPVTPLKESGAHQKKKPLSKGLFFKILKQVLFSIGDASHFADHCYFHLSGILHIALNFLRDIEA